MIRAFGLEGADAAFHQRLVVGIGCSAHRDRDMMRRQELLVSKAGVLVASVGMMQKLVIFGLASCQRHL